MSSCHHVILSPIPRNTWEPKHDIQPASREKPHSPGSLPFRCTSWAQSRAGPASPVSYHPRQPPPPPPHCAHMGKFAHTQHDCTRSFKSIGRPPRQHSLLPPPTVHTREKSHTHNTIAHAAEKAWVGHPDSTANSDSLGCFIAVKLNVCRVTMCLWSLHPSIGKTVHCRTLSEDVSHT